LLSLLLAGLTVFFSVRFSASSAGTDFPDFYCASRMLMEGHGHQLYDAELQRQYQARYAGRVGTLYIHPPFETIVYLAVSWLPLKKAYLLWCLLNFAFLAFTARTAAREAHLPWDWRILLAASLTFVPVLLCLLQGQDSILLLGLVTAAFAALRSERAFAGGFWLGLGLFKFELVLPLALVFAVRRGRSGFLKGFGLAALALAGLSAGISGMSVFGAYPRFLLHLQEQPFAGIAPLIMANLRGLVYFFFRTDRSPLAIAAVAILSAGALVLTLLTWRDGANISGVAPVARGESQFNRAFATATLCALLVSYHLNPHDLSVLLLPTVLLLRSDAGTSPLSNPPRWWMYGLIALVFLPPLHLFALQTHTYALVSIPLIALFVGNAFGLRTAKPQPS